jgi:hypothetical protein
MPPISNYYKRVSVSADTLDELMKLHGVRPGTREKLIDSLVHITLANQATTMRERRFAISQLNPLAST